MVDMGARLWVVTDLENISALGEFCGALVVNNLHSYMALSSRHGIVNVYGSQGSTSFTEERPKPIKSLGNLTTSITSLRFNQDSQLMAMASDSKKDQMRLVRLSLFL